MHRAHFSACPLDAHRRPYRALPAARWACLATLLAALLLPAAAHAQNDKPVRVAVVQSFFRDVGKTQIKVVTLAIGGLMQQHTGLKADITIAADADAIGDGMDKNQIDLAMVQGYEFAWLQQEHSGLKPLLVAINQKPSGPVLLVAKAGGPVTQFTDLKGKRISLPRLSAAQCELFLQRQCAGAGCEPDKFLDKIVAHPSVEDGLDDVIRGKVEAAVVDSRMLECYVAVKPGAAALLKTVESTASFPSAVLIYRQGGLSAQAVDTIRNGMAKANQCPKSRGLMSLLSFTGFEPVPANYQKTLDTIRAAYPAPTAQTSAKAPSARTSKK